MYGTQASRDVSLRRSAEPQANSCSAPLGDGMHAQSLSSRAVGRQIIHDKNRRNEKNKEDRKWPWERYAYKSTWHCAAHRPLLSVYVLKCCTYDVLYYGGGRLKLKRTPFNTRDVNRDKYSQSDRCQRDGFFFDALLKRMSSWYTPRLVLFSYVLTMNSKIM